MEVKPSPVATRLVPVCAELDAFMLDYFAGDGIRVKPPADNLLFDAGVTSIVLYREGQFQVEMIVVSPHTRIRPHVHDDVDSYEVAFAGAIDFFVSHLQAGHVRAPRPNGATRDFGRFVPIASIAPHHGMSGAIGACFLSVQYWRNGRAPTHVGLNWRDTEN